MRNLAVLFVSGALLVACGGSVANAPTKSAAPPGPVTKYRNTLPGLNATAAVDLIQNVIDFAPGAASVVHVHTTPNLATVLQGQITVKTQAGDKQATEGQMLVEPVNQPLQAVNAASGETMVVVAFVVPHGGKPTAPVAGKPSPATLNKTLYAFTLSSPSLSGAYSAVQQIQDFAPGSQTSKFRVGGPGVFTVLQGRVVLNSDGAERTFGLGESFAVMPGQTLQVFNQESSQSSVAATFLLPEGAQLRTNL